ncbi:MAG: MFS transporter [Pseudomonadota bacterium]
MVPTSRTCESPVGIFFLMPLAQYMIDTLSWQTTWQIFGICGGVLLVFTALLLRPAPAIKVTQTDSELTPAYVHQWTRAEVLRSVTFWKLAVSFGILMFSISTVAMFRVPFFIEQGLSAKWVALAFSSEAVVSALVAIPVGLLIERYQIHHLTAIGFAFAIIMLLLTIYTDTLVELFLATAVFGMGAASVIILQNTIWPTYFGSQHIGAIRGVAMPVTLGFAVMGAPIAGWVRDTTGSFVPIWWATIAAMIVAIILILTTPKPADPEQ